MSLRLLLANAIYYLHVAMIFFILFGSFALPPKYLKYYIYFVLLVLLDWNDLDGMCILTKLEYYLRTGQWISKSALEGGPEFFRPLVNKLLRLNLSREECERANYSFMTISLLIAFYRYSNQKEK